MTHTPEFDTFAKLAAKNHRVPVYRRLLCDSLTPVSAFHKIDSGGAACLFESVIGGEKVGRFSFLAVDPFRELSAFRKHIIIQSSDQVEQYDCDDPLDELHRQLSNVQVASVPGLAHLPFVAGAVGYTAYDMIRYTENLPDAPEDDRELPDLAFAFYDQLIVFDNVTKTMLVIVLANTEGDIDASTVYRRAQEKLDQTIERLANPDSELDLHDIDSSGKLQLSFQSNFEKQRFEDAVRSCVEYIRAGDIFQVVISQRLQVEISADPFDIYRTLRVVNPSPFMFFLRTNDATLVGSSPEIMCRVMENKVTVRPLAGTRRRGQTDQEDQQLADELLADPKERAEHVMLVDLGRNDVGRVAKYRSVELSDVMTIERYSHVMHITSNVTGELAEDQNAFDALRACVPAGTVSGAPKVRAMEIIDELEPHRRGPYAGAVGYIDYGGNMDTCIALRTMVVQGQTAYVQAGAGVVADSVPELEYQETLNKAKGLLKAIEITEQRTSASQQIKPQ
ncbi:MAG: anthranilate synthase component I [Pirellulaceae bacterium]|nr:anthranilate synthase component I [Pirellulaceae bacterium]